MKTTQMKIQGMTCSGCVNHVHKALIKHEGVINADVDLASGTATIEHQNVEVSSLENAIRDAGYSVVSE
jgi:Cu+-exporting ATPase